MRALFTGFLVLLFLPLGLSAQLAITPERAVSVPSLVRSKDANQVDIATNGELMLAVWMETRGSTSAVIAARVAADGTVLDPAGLVLSYSERFTVANPLVAWDGEAFVVIWSRLPRLAPFTLETWASRVDVDGRVLRPGGTHIAYGGPQALGVRGNQVAAVITEPNVIAPGVSRCHAGLLSEELTFAPASSVAPCDGARLAHFGGGYLMAWTAIDRTNATTVVRAVRLHGNASALGSEFPVHGLGPFTGGARIAMAASGSDVLIAAGSDRLDVVRITPELNIRQATPVSPASAGAQLPSDIVVLGDGTYDVVVQPYGDGGVHRFTSGDRFVATENFEQSASPYNAATLANGRTFIVSADEAVTGQYAFGPENVVLISRRAEQQYDPSLATNGTNVLAVWSENRGDEHNTMAATLMALDGTPITGTLTLADSVHRGNTAAGVDGAGFFAVWFDDPDNGSLTTTLSARRVTEAGAGSTIILSENANLDASPAVSSDGQNAVIAWSEGQYFEPRVVVGTLSGVRTPVSGAAVDSVMAWNGTWHLLAANGVNGRIRGAVIDRTAGVRSSFDLTLFPARNPALAWNGSAYLLVYQRDLFLESILLDAEGRELGPRTTVALPDANYSFERPRVAWDGRTFIVTWMSRSQKLSRNLLVARRVSASGQPLGNTTLVADLGFDASRHALLALPDGRTMLAYPRIDATAVSRIFTRRITEARQRAVSH